jgi:hypothetical protein
MLAHQAESLFCVSAILAGRLRKPEPPIESGAVFAIV